MKKLIIFATLVLVLLLSLAACAFGGSGHPCDEGHVYEEYVIEEPTCTELGRKELYCKQCGDQQFEDIPALGHNEVTTPGKEATCTETGLTDKVECDRCDTVLTESTTIPVKEHEIVVDFISAPDHIYQGFVDFKCENCTSYTKQHTLKNIEEFEYTLVKSENETKTFSHTIDGVSFEFDVSNFTVTHYQWPNFGQVIAIAAYWGDSTNVIIPEFSDYYEGQKITAILADAFRGNESIVSVTLHESIFRIQDEAFMGCTSLESIIVPEGNKVNIGKQTFYGCTSLKSVNFAHSVGDRAFKGCTSLESVSLAGDIGERAFSGCTALVDVNIDWSINSYNNRTIGLNAFENCTGIKSLTIPSNFSTGYQDAKGILKGCTNLEFLSVPAALCPGYLGYIFTERTETSVWYPEDNALVPATLKRVEITGGATSFTDCANIEYVGFIFNAEDGYYEYISIMDEAFKNCTALQEVKIDGKISSFGTDVFVGCDNLGGFTTYENCVYFGSEENPYQILVSFTDETPDEIAELVIQDGTQAISNHLLFGKNITSITVPASIDDLGQFAYSFTNFYFKGTIADWFNYYFSFPGQNPMGTSVNFYWLDSNSQYVQPTDLVIPESVTAISHHQFYGLEFTTITLHGGIETIYAKMPESLEKVYFSGTIENWMKIYLVDAVKFSSELEGFYMLDANGEWKSITTIVVPETVTRIPDYAFKNLGIIDTVVIPASVTELGYNMFYGCDKLTNVFYGGTAEQWEALISKENVDAPNVLQLYTYSEDEYTLEDYLSSGALYWHYDAEGNPVAWVKITNTLDGKTFNYTTSTITVSYQYWGQIAALKDAGMLNQVLDPNDPQYDMIMNSSTKEEFGAKLTAYAIAAGQGATISFKDGKMTYVKDGQTIVRDYVECDGVVYVKVLKWEKFCYIDSETQIREYKDDGKTVDEHTYILKEN